MLPSTSVPLFLVKVPVIRRAEHVVRTLPFVSVVRVFPTFVPRKVVPTGTMVPVGCVMSGSFVAIACDGRVQKAARATKARRAIMDLHFMKYPLGVSVRRLREELASTQHLLTKESCQKHRSTEQGEVLHPPKLVSTSTELRRALRASLAEGGRRDADFGDQV